MTKIASPPKGFPKLCFGGLDELVVESERDPFGGTMLIIGVEA